MTWLKDNETLAVRFVRPETLPRRAGDPSAGRGSTVFFVMLSLYQHERDGCNIW